MDKTPKFTAKIDKILKGLKPHNRFCSICQSEFDIVENDIEFFNKFKVPVPSKCPDCRRQIRLAFANYTTLFKRKCDAPNHEEKIISSIPASSKFPVYDFDYYHSDKRDCFDYAIDYDFDKSFFKQFNDLFLKSPQPALTRDPTSMNSEYSSYGAGLKDCYYTFGGLNSENCMFAIWPMNTKNSLDFLININTDFCYEAVFSENCYNCNFVYFSNNCIDSNFVYDCKNCNDCFGCVNLRNSKYCIWNKQYTKDEYCERIKEFNLGNRNNLEEYKKIFYRLISELPIRSTRNSNSENFSGNYILNTKNCHDSSWILLSDNVKYSDFSSKAKDVYDCTITYMSEQLYGTSTVGSPSFNVKFSNFGRNLQNCEYVMGCRNCTYCFLCIGLENAKYCILNRQYTEDEYWKLVDNIKIKMLEDGEYGEFFPISLSPFPYNASLSNIIYPTSKERVLELGGWWYDEEINLPKEMKLLKGDEIKLDIKDITDNILDVGIISERSGKPFRIVKDELEFYRRKNISIPSLTPYERIIDRFKYVNNFKVFKDKCFKCGVEILSSYATDEGFKPYCDDCYKKEIY